MAICSVPDLLRDDSHDKFMNARREEKGEESSGALSHSLIAQRRGVNMLE